MSGDENYSQYNMEESREMQLEGNWALRKWCIMREISLLHTLPGHMGAVSMQRKIQCDEEGLGLWCIYPGVFPCLRAH